MRISARLRILRTMAAPTLKVFGHSRAWNREELLRAQRALNYGVRRAMGMNTWIMHDRHVTDQALYQAANWEPFEHLIMRESLQWLGNVARMPLDRRPKQMLFGWVSGMHTESLGGRILQPVSLARTLETAGMPEIDWFRRAQGRRGSRKTITTMFPTRQLADVRARALDAWRPGEPLPAAEAQERPPEPRPPAGHACPVCEHTAMSGQYLHYHNNEHHSVRDPDVVTPVSAV